MTDEKKTTGAPSGAQTGSTAAGSPAAGQGGSQVLTGEQARSAYPRQVDAAIEYASANKYDYGPKLRNVELEYSVESARPMDDGITRIVLGYRPANKFKGESGSEYLDVDSRGVVQARRQIRVPKESMPWVLVGVAALSVIAAAVLVPLILLVEPKADTTFVAGRTLWVRSDQPRIGPYITYDATDTEGTERTWIIIPEGEGTSIAWVNVTLINQTSGVVSLSIDTNAAELTTESGITVRPVDIFERVAWPLEGEPLDPRLEVLGLPLWGSRQLESGQQLEGFVAFEVPRGSKIRSLRWSATDVANIRY